MLRAAARTVVLAALVAAPAAAAIGCNADPPLDVAPSVDYSAFQGKWYEIAKLPRVTQTDCHGTTAFYSRKGTSFALVNQCNVGAADGPLKTVTMTATTPDDAVPAKLALDVGGFVGDYWILEVGKDYEYAVIGHPSRTYLWILSRSPTLDSATLGGIVDRAKANQFDTTKLEFTPQPPMGERIDSDAPVGEVPQPQGHGCAAAAAPAGGAGAGAVAAALAVGLAHVATRWRRRARPARRS